MYLSATNEILEIALSGAVNTNELTWFASYQDITSAGATLPMLSAGGLTSGATPVTMVVAPASSTTRQLATLIIFNNDVAAAEVTITRDVGGTNYPMYQQTLQPKDTLSWSKDLGWQISQGAGGEGVTFSVFSSSGTYTKPAGLKAAFIVAIGGGGGAGSGRRGATSTTRAGGGGGAGGTFVSLLVPASGLVATVAVTVGAGGVGGAAVTSDSTNGANGTNGGDSLFGGIVLAKGGLFGSGGNTSSGTPGAASGASTSSPMFGPYALNGSAGGAGAQGSGNSANTGFTGNIGAPGGGGGGGINGSNTAATSGGNGGGVYQNGTLISGPTSAGVFNGSNNQSVFLHQSQTLTSGYGLGTGGAGGFPSSGKYDGGNGGNYGAGGGGGAASLNGTNSGKGGDGGGGLCVVMNIF